MTLIQVIVLLVTGAAAGFAGGMFGVGGAFLMSPVQFWVYQHQGIEPDLAIRIAFGTSLLVVLVVAGSGTLQHHKEKAVMWKTAFVMGGCAMAGSFAGAIIGSQLPHEALKIIFGAALLAAGIRMLVSFTYHSGENTVCNPWMWAALALPLGVFTGIIGIGGGIILVPLLTLVLRFRLHNAIATSMAIVIFSSTGGVAGYLVSGAFHTTHLEWTFGYVNLQSWFLLAIGAVGTARAGAWLAHRLPEKRLRYVFVALLLFMGLRMIGVFGWFGLPF